MESLGRGFRKEAHQFYSSVLWLHPGPVNPVSHPHQIMHTHAPKQRKKEKKRTTYKCKMFISLPKSSEQPLRCVLNVLYWHQVQNCDRRHLSVQHDPQTTWMPTVWGIISGGGDMVHSVILFIRPTEEPLVDDHSEREVMEHSLVWNKY